MVRARWARSSWARALGAAAVASALVLGLRAGGLLEPLELRAWDALLRARPAATPLPVRVALVRIDEDDIRRFGHPLPDAVLADALARLRAAGASAIGVDLYRDRPVPPGAVALREAVQADPRVVMVEKVPDGHSPGVAPPPFLRGPERRDRVAFSDLVIDPDGVVRRALLLLWDRDGRPRRSLAFALALRHLAPDGIAPEPVPGHPEWMRLGRAELRPFEGSEGGYVHADARGHQMLLDYRHSEGDWPSASLATLLDGALPPGFAAGRVVLVGTRSPSVRDDFFTPLRPESATGVVVHAAAVDQLLRRALDGDPAIRGWGFGAAAAWIAGFALAGGAAGAALRGPWALGAGAAGLVGLAVGWAAAAAARGLWLPVVPAAAAALTAAGLGLAAAFQRERAERALLQRLFGRYVPAEVARHLRARSDELLADGRPRPRRLRETVMMLDVEGSSRAAEQMPSDDFVAWIDRGLGGMARIAEAHGGSVEYFSGDGMKVDFGIPVPRQGEDEVTADARAALAAAREIARALDEWNAEWRARGWPRMRVRIGLHTGETVAGSVGHEGRLQYTTLGETANLAARLEGFEKEGFRNDLLGRDCRILLSRETRERLGAQPGLPDFRETGRLTRPGGAASVPVFEVIEP